MNKVYFNKMQREAMQIGARDTVIVAGRGTGKGLLHAAVNLRNFQAMPRSTTAFVVPAASRALVSTIPSMTRHWEAWGYRRDVHWMIGRRPPKSLGWPLPLIEPQNWENVISFYTGAVGIIISQDRKGTSNSLSVDFVDIDEAKLVKFERLKEETFQSNRGQIREFGDCPWHHGMLISSDMPVTKEGSWFLRYEKSQDAELIEAIRALTLREAHIKGRLNEGGASVYHEGCLRKTRRQLTALRRHALYYGVYSSLTNMEVLGEEYIRQMKRDLPPLVFQTSVLCRPIGILKDGFYSSMRESHKYSAADYHHIDKLDYDFDAIRAMGCNADADIRRDRPLCIAFDFNRNINWLVVGQADEDERVMRTLKSFWVKYERKLPELINDLCDYYDSLPLHEVTVYYDTTALGSNYAVNDQDFLYVITHTLESRGWMVTPVFVGNPMNHADKHLLINQGFAGRQRLTPLFNEENNPDLLLSIQTAGVYNGKKDKRGEKLAETEEDKLEARTDGSDAWDTLYIGCELFPNNSVGLCYTSNWA